MAARDRMAAVRRERSPMSTACSLMAWPQSALAPFLRARLAVTATFLIRLPTAGAATSPDQIRKRVVHVRAAAVAIGAQTLKRWLSCSTAETWTGAGFAR